MPAGRHHLQIPGPTNVPDRVLRAMSYPTIDHRGPQFARLGREVIDGLKAIVRTDADLALYPGSGTGGWEAALVNTLSPGDGVLAFDMGHFATLWAKVASDLGLNVTLVPGDWTRGVDASDVESHLVADTDRRIKAVLVVHNETSTGVTTQIPQIRAAIDRADHPALLLVDAVSSLGSLDYRHDEWGIDVTVAGSQKGLMTPPGLSVNAISDKAKAASASAGLARSYWDWSRMFESNTSGMFPYTPATNLIFGLREAITLLHEEGLDHVLARHRRHAEATRRAVHAWGLEVQCRVPEEYSAALTAVRMPTGYDADALRSLILDRFDMSLGAGLSKLSGAVFRIGHLGDLNDLSLVAALGGVEAGLRLAGVPYKAGGTEVGIEYLADTAVGST